MTSSKSKWVDPKLADSSSVFARVVDALGKPAAYPWPIDCVEHHETHISHVFLAGDFAYKVKKPISTGFLDYRDLEKRRQFCSEEVRLGRRYADDLYISVVPIALKCDTIHVECEGPAIEYAVKMRRFAEDALLSTQIDLGEVASEQLRALAETIANFHSSASRSDHLLGTQAISFMFRNLKEVLSQLRSQTSERIATRIDAIERWCDEYVAVHRPTFESRAADGFVRECHGDLHLRNIVRWKERWVPFDGIEFNDDLRWIDVLNDSAFLEMDLAAEERFDLAYSFINAYLERTGDYTSLAVLRLYLVYRALIRGMVAMMDAAQHAEDSQRSDRAREHCNAFVDLAYRFHCSGQPSLSITHGLSGSGKTTLSERYVQQFGAIRLRSDVERKRLFQSQSTTHQEGTDPNQMYSEFANNATYDRLENLSKKILRSGYSVIVDATFLRRSDRNRFRCLAEGENVPFGILECSADIETLRNRITERNQRGDDASEANLNVLEQQIRSHEPLGKDELHWRIYVPTS